MRRFYFALLPWAMFDIVLRSAGLSVTWGAAIAIATTVTVAFLVQPGEFGTLGAASFATFTGLLLAALIEHTGHPFRPYARGIATGALGVVCLGSAIAWPCTSQYTRWVTAPRYWARREFRSFNTRLSLAWGCTFIAVAGLDVLAVHLRSPVATTAFNWILPLCFLIGVGLRTDHVLTQEFDRNEPTIDELVETIGELELVVRPGRIRRSNPLGVYRGDAPAP